MSRRRLPVLPLLMLLILFTTAFTRSSLARAAYWLNRGAIAYNSALAGQPDRVALAEAHLARSGDLPASQRLQGFVLLAQGREAAAVQVWQMAPAMATELIRWGDLDRAGQTSWYELAAAVDPADETAQIAHCNELLDGAAYQAVRTLYLGLPAPLPATPGLQVCAGAAELALGEAEQAVALIGRAVVMAPARAAYWQWYSLALTRTGRFDEAIAASERATGLAPASADYWEHLGNLYQESQQTTLARQAYQTALTLAPANERIRAALAGLPPAP